MSVASRSGNAVGALVTRTVRMAATGALGVLTVDGARRLIRSGATRRGAVTATAWGLRGRQRAEVVAESAWLGAADIVAEARQRVGEQSPPPGAASATPGHDHDH